VNVESRAGTNVPPSGCSLRVSELGDSVVLVIVVGPVSAHHASDLWSTIEGALEIAAGGKLVGRYELKVVP
jgi:hypothetical protein